MSRQFLRNFLDFIFVCAVSLFEISSFATVPNLNELTLLKELGIPGVRREVFKTTSAQQRGTIRLPLSIVTFSDTFDDHFIREQLEVFNSIYARCGIQLDENVVVSVLMAEGEISELRLRDYGKFIGPADARFDRLQKFYAQMGIPILYFKEPGKDFVYPKLALVAGATVSYRFIQQPDAPELMDRFAPLAVFINGDRNASFRQARISTLAHELGHALGLSHVNNGANLMYRSLFVPTPQDDFQQRGTGLSTQQCEQARRGAKAELAHDPIVRRLPEVEVIGYLPAPETPWPGFSRLFVKTMDASAVREKAAVKFH